MHCAACSGSACGSLSSATQYCSSPVTVYLAYQIAEPSHLTSLIKRKSRQPIQEIERNNMGYLWWNFAWTFLSCHNVSIRIIKHMSCFSLSYLIFKWFAHACRHLRKWKCATKNNICIWFHMISQNHVVITFSSFACDIFLILFYVIHHMWFAQSSGII